MWKIGTYSLLWIVTLTIYSPVVVSGVHKNCAKVFRIISQTSTEMHLLFRHEIDKHVPGWVLEIDFNYPVKAIKLNYRNPITPLLLKTTDDGLFKWIIGDFTERAPAGTRINMVIKVLFEGLDVPTDVSIAAVTLNKAHLCYDRSAAGFSIRSPDLRVMSGGYSSGGQSQKPAVSKHKGECGIQRAKGRILRGVETYPGEFPWVVAIYLKPKHYVCVGSLLNVNTVLTAGHCVSARKVILVPRSLIVYAGLHDKSNMFAEYIQQREVNRVVLHPSFDQYLLSNDIAILKLKSPFQLNNVVFPVCIGDTSNNYGVNGVVAGWGKDETHKLKDILAKATLIKTQNSNCRSTHKQLRFVSETAFCAGFRNGTNTCFGDSGGGMFFKNNGIFYVRGVVSYGVGDVVSKRCYGGFFDVFTNVDKYLDWIRKYV